MIDDAGGTKLHVGFKQAVKAINQSRAQKVFVAEDCDNHIKDSIRALAEENNVPLEYIPTMKELGGRCSIDVGASCAVILK